MPGVAGSVGAPSSLAAARVLVAGEGTEDRDGLAGLLRRLGIAQVEQAADGTEALARIARTPFDLVFLNTAPPGAPATELLERLRAARVLERTPVVILAPLTGMDLVARCVSLGAEDYLFAPVDPVLLHARIMSSLERKRLRDRTRDVLAARAAELAQARTLQQALVPPPLRAPGLAVDLLLEPAREIGGDLVDHFPVGAGGASGGPGLHAVLVGDVSDKGAAAALVMARAHALLHGLLIRPDAAEVLSDPARALTILNAALASRNDGTMFATALLAVLDGATGRLRYCRAGHVPPWLRRADGSQARLDALGGVPLGVVDDAEYHSAEVALAPGDVLLAVSDGVTEAEAPGGAQFGEASVEACLDLCRGREDDLLPTLLSQVRAHEAGRPAGDDLAALLLRIPAPQEGTGAAGAAVRSRPPPG